MPQKEAGQPILRAKLTVSFREGRQEKGSKTEASCKRLFCPINTQSIAEILWILSQEYILLWHLEIWPKNINTFILIHIYNFYTHLYNMFMCIHCIVCIYIYIYIVQAYIYTLYTPYVLALGARKSQDQAFCATRPRQRRGPGGPASSGEGRSQGAEVSSTAVFAGGRVMGNHYLYRIF